MSVTRGLLACAPLLAVLLRAPAVGAQPLPLPPAVSAAEKKGDFAEAARLLEAVIAKEGDDPWRQFQLGELLRRAGNGPRAIAAFDAVIAQGGRVSRRAHYYLAGLRAKSEPDKALKHLDKAILQEGTTYDEILYDSSLEPLKAMPQYKTIIADLEARVIPCKTQPEYRPIAFLVGDWTVAAPSGKPSDSRRVTLRWESQECVVFEQNKEMPRELTMVYWVPADERWRFLRIDASRERFEMNGTLRDGVLHLTGKGVDDKGQPTELRGTFAPTPANGDKPKQLQLRIEASRDGGKTFAVALERRYDRR